MKPIIAITMGDPVGIGPEIIVKAFAKELSAICCPVVIGHARCMAHGAAHFAPGIVTRQVTAITQCKFEPGVLEVLDRSLDSASSPPPLWQYGVPHPEGSQAAIDAIKEATRLAMANEVDAIATAPINKEALKKVGFVHPGHTEFLAHLAGVTRFGMMMVGGGLKIMLTTIHMPLAKVSGIVGKGLILEKIGLTHEVLKTYFGLPQGRIAVAAFNPHGGENGLFGTEETDSILPAVLAAKEKGINATGPYPADTLFFQVKEGRFDAAVALYHDQALIPIKLLSFGRGVNVTVGLPFIRTSVDHGTAYDIAGKGKADPGSLIEAVLLAVQMAKNRRA
jgi:4-hydroxythreonine-4-phosphate dehydrogenase